MKHINKSTKRAFTLIELLIVIAIIGILFVVLVSKVDFATDKAKATGVQADFRSFQVAFETVSKENAGFASLGWDTGDENGDRIRNSYDEGDTDQDGVVDTGETWTGHKVYSETWFGIYTLINPDDNTDKSAFKLLEDKVNANLDPKLHITITPEENAGVLTGNANVSMANAAKDPWKNEYHGAYITNALNDAADRGAFVLYSNGANGQWGSEHDIANGVVTVTVPGNNVRGKDDMSIVVCYTYVNGYGESQILTTGFSNNQKFLSGNSGDMSNNIVPGDTEGYPFKGVEYHFWSGQGQTLVFDEDSNLHIYSYKGEETMIIPASCFSFNSTSEYYSFVVNNTGMEDIDGSLFMVDLAGDYIGYMWNGNLELFGMRKGLCDHTEYGTTDGIRWYYWYDANMNEIDLSTPPSLEIFKTYTLHCGTCLEQIPTMTFEDSDYIYVWNTYVESQFDENGNVRQNGRCIDTHHWDKGGWIAVQYDLSKSANLHTTINGQQIVGVMRDWHFEPIN